jgi:hypothetical protein
MNRVAACFVKCGAKVKTKIFQNIFQVEKSFLSGNFYFFKDIFGFLETATQQAAPGMNTLKETLINAITITSLIFSAGKIQKSQQGNHY